MPLEFGPAPENGWEVLTAGLRAAGPKAFAGIPRAAGPIPVYDLSPDELAAGQASPQAPPTTWRYLLAAGERVDAAADLVTVPGPPPTLRFGGVSTGFVPGLVEGIAVSEARVAAEPNGRFEPRLLRVAPLQLAVLWVAALGAEAGADWYVVLAPAPADLPVRTPMPPAELFGRLRPVAARHTRARAKAR